jgi:hypothetical protein
MMRSWRAVSIMSGVLSFVLMGACLAQDTTASLAPYHADDGYQRWRDIATYLYDSGQKDPLFYDAGAEVTVDYTYTGTQLVATVTGTNLKPNFAYQLKLNGKPTLSFGDTDGDDASNEALGYAGRWWVSQVEKDGTFVAGWNSDDTEYEDWLALDFTDGTYDYVFYGYLLFDFLITDATGSAVKDVVLDSSFHVLWKTTQRAPREGIDSAVTVHRVVADRRTEWYSKKYRSKDVGIFAEWEPTRAFPGELAMAPGFYNVSLYLTEESFHETSPDSGGWATVMSCDTLEFEIAAPAAHDVGVTAVVVPASVDVDSSQVVTVSVANYGASDEVASITLTDATDASAVGTEEVAVAAGQVGVVEFQWNTTGATLGDHVLTAVATIVGDEDGTNDAKSTTVAVTDPGPVPTMTASLDVTAGAVGRKFAATAAVTVLDGQGGPVAGALVTVAWNVDGKVLVPSTGTTDASGAVVHTSPQSVLKKDAAGIFTGTVTDVVKTGYVYDDAQPSDSAGAR